MCGHLRFDKHALEAIAEALQQELAPYGIKVQTINPGACYTGYNETMSSPQFPSRITRSGSRHVQRIREQSITRSRDANVDGDRYAVPDTAAKGQETDMTSIATIESPHSGTRSAPAATPIVFVVDDDISVRESLELLIQSSGWQPETFVSAQEFLARPRALVPSCLVLDVDLPDLNGLDLQRRVAAERSDMPVIFITGNGDVPTSVQAMKAGAIEFLTKPFRDDVLLSAIRHGLERSRRAVEHDQTMKPLRENYASLTPREREVMVLVTSGLLNKQVGGELGISEITVKAHRGQVMRKMKAESLPALVNMVARLGLATALAA